MKRFVCLLLVLMLCVCSAYAETVEMNGITLNIPAGWRVDDTWQDAEELSILTLSPILEEAPQNIFVSRSNFDNWDSMSSIENMLKGLLKAMMMDELEEGEPYVQEYVALYDGGFALKVVYTTNDISRGVVRVLSKDGMAILSVNAAKDQAAQCDAWLSEMLLPLQVQEIIEVGGLPVGLPAGFVKNDENGMYFNEYNEAINVFTLDITQEDAPNLLTKMSDEEVLLLMMVSQIGDLEYSNVQSESLERDGVSALISSMDITANGNSGCMGTLTALSGDTVVGVSYLGNQGDEQAAADLMKVITFPLQKENGFSINGMDFLCPEGFKVADYEKNGEVVSVMISDQLLPEMTVISTPLTEEEKQMDVRTLLSTKFQEEFSNVTGSEVKTKVVDYDGATAFHITWCMEDVGVKYANGIAFVATKDHLIRIYSKWPDGDTEYVGSVLDGMLPSPAGGETVSQGNVTLCIPNGWQLQESVQEDGREYSAQGTNGGLGINYWSVMPDGVRMMIDDMDVQTALEIQLSMFANDIGVEGITIDYAQNESGVHMVTSTFMHPQYAAGWAFLLDGDAFWYVELYTVNEEEARVLLDGVLEQVR